MREYIGKVKKKIVNSIWLSPVFSRYSSDASFSVAHGKKINSDKNAVLYTARIPFWIRNIRHTPTGSPVRSLQYEREQKAPFSLIETESQVLSVRVRLERVIPTVYNIRLHGRFVVSIRSRERNESFDFNWLIMGI